MKKVVIVDDEAPARSLLKEYLYNFPSMVVVGEANNGVDAIKIIEEFNPDIVFLDVQMPGINGLEVLQRLTEMPKIIFSTAYDQYALDAFEHNAIDFLLKPYTRERFARAVNKVMQYGEENLSSIKALAENLLQGAHINSSKYPSKILVQSKNKLVALDTFSIIWIEAEKDYSNLRTAKQCYLSNYGIGQIAGKLDPEIFIRIHRSSIINIHFIKEIFKHPSSYDVKMTNGDVVRVSRSYLDNIRKLTF